MPSIEESLAVDADVRPWHEDQSPFELIARACAGMPAGQPLAVEHTTRHFIVDHVSRVSGFDRPIISGEALVNACRMIKSPAEIALMEASAAITIDAIRHVHDNLEAGMSAGDIRKILESKMTEQGGTRRRSRSCSSTKRAPIRTAPKNRRASATAPPSSSTPAASSTATPPTSRAPGCTAKPSARQREVWETVKRGQEIALESAKIGQPVGDVDIAVRNYYEGKGWAKNYGLPGTSHRTGHGIGMDGHEPPNLMRADRTPLAGGHVLSPTSPGSTFPANSGSAWKIAGS